MKWFKKEPKLDLHFADTTGHVYQQLPIMKAGDVKPIAAEKQKKEQGRFSFAMCPGMADYSKLGYLVPAWVDIHIMINKAGCVWKIGSDGRGDRGFSNGRKMDPKLIDGMYDVDNDIEPTVLHFGSPWAIFANKNISAMVMPAFYHSTLHNHLHIFPGVVDYQNYHQINLICMPRKSGEIHISAGEPLFQVIPFFNKDISAGYGPADEHQKNKYGNGIPGGDKQYYRKYFSVKKIFGLEKGNG